MKKSDEKICLRNKYLCFLQLKPEFRHSSLSFVRLHFFLFQSIFILLLRENNGALYFERICTCLARASGENFQRGAKDKIMQ